MLRELAPGLWVAEQPLRFLGTALGARMTVVRLARGSLLLHSPIAATGELCAAVDALGSVSCVVAPNRFHHLYAGEWCGRHPAARLFVAPGLEARRPDLPVHGILGDASPEEWSGALEQVAVSGMPILNEIVFFHRATRTLIASDLAFNIRASSPLSARIASRLWGSYGRLAPTLIERLTVRDRPAFRASLERILTWPFERVIVAHGEIQETGGREALRAGYRWALCAAQPSPTSSE
jgi:hypothetical protein